MRARHVPKLLVTTAAIALAGIGTGACRTPPSAPSGAASFGVCGSVDTSTGDELAAICDSGHLRVVSALRNEAPLWFDAQSPQWEGFDADVATEVATRLGVQANLLQRPPRPVTDGSWGDRWDVSLGLMGDAARGGSALAFTPPYVYMPMGLAVNSANTTIEDVDADLDGKRICVGASTASVDYLEGSLSLGKQSPAPTSVIDDPTIVQRESETDALSALALGDGLRCDAAIAALPTIEQFARDGGAIRQVGAPLYQAPLSVAMDNYAPEDSRALVTTVSQIVDDMHADGTLSSLSMKWFGTDLTSIQNPTASASP